MRSSLPQAKDLVRFMLLAFFSAESAHGTSIGLFSSSDCSSCGLLVPESSGATLYVRASTAGLPDDEYLTTAEFRIEGMPSGWLWFGAPNPDAIIFGNPFSSAGVTVTFTQNAQQGECIDLFSGTIVATNAVRNGRLRVVAPDPPPNPAIPCPRIFTICSNRACDNVYCASGGSMLLNSDSECTVGIQQHTWTHVRELYR